MSICRFIGIYELITATLKNSGTKTGVQVLAYNTQKDLILYKKKHLATYHVMFSPDRGIEVIQGTDSPHTLHRNELATNEKGTNSKLNIFNL